MKKIAIVLLILSIFILAGCGSSSSGDTTYIVKVAVKTIDNQTGKVINTGTVKTANGKAGNSSNGITTFKIEGKKDYTFIANAPYYNQVKKKVHIGKENVSISVKLSRANAKITGKVVDTKENGLKANIKIIELDRSIESDSNGNFTFTNVPITGSTYTLEVSKSGYGIKKKSNIELVKDQVKDIGKIVLENTPGTISGRIKDPQGNALSNVTVTIVETGNSTISDSNGEFSLENLPGDYNLEFSEPNYETYSRPITIKSEQDTFINVELEPKPGKITGIVKDEYDYPITGCEVMVTELNKTTETLSNGTFEIETPPGRYRVSINHPQFKENIQEVTVRSTEETGLGNIILIEKTGFLQGRVINKDTKDPIANATAKILELGDQGIARTDSTGYFYYNNVRIGTYTLEISATDYSTEQITNVEVLEQKTTTVPDTELIKDPATILGTIRDSLLDEPIQDALVTVNETGDQVKTDQYGNFKMANLKAGTYSLTISLDNYQVKNVDSIYAGPNQTVNLGNVSLTPKPAEIQGTTNPGNANLEILETGTTTISDGAGSFTFSSIEPYKNYTIQATKTNYYSDSVSVKTDPNGLHQVGEIKLQPKPGKIIGSTNAEEAEILETGQMAAINSGVFEFTNVQPGNYTIELRKTNYYSKQISVTVDPNQTVDKGTINLDPKPGTITGYLNTKANVTLVNTGDSHIDYQGYYEFNNLSPGKTYYVRLARSGYYPIVKEITIDPGQTVDLGSTQPTYLDDLNEGEINQNSKSVYAKSTSKDVTVTDSKIIPLDYAQDVTFSYEISKANEDGRAKCTFYDAGINLGAWNSTTSVNKTVKVSTPIGEHTLYAEAKAEYATPHIAQGTVTYTIDNKTPGITFSQTYGTTNVDHSVQINASDSEAGIKNLYYKWSSSKNKPSDVEWKNMSNGEVVTQSNTGIWYLHARAVDNAGNEAYMWVGPFIVN